MKILFIAPKYTGGIGGHAKRVAENVEQKILVGDSFLAHLTEVEIDLANLV